MEGHFQVLWVTGPEIIMIPGTSDIIGAVQ